jgi:hypothetical protein
MEKSRFLLEQVIADLKGTPMSRWVTVFSKETAPVDQPERREVFRFSALLSGDRVARRTLS